MYSKLYQLHAIIMHRGNAYSGHYFAYIRDCLEEGNWQPPSMTSSSNSSSSKLDELAEEEVEKTMYMEGSNGEVFVREGSVLATLVECFEQLEKGITDVGGLSKKLRNNTGVSWNERYKRHYGSMLEFLRQIPIFEIVGTKLSLDSAKTITITSDEQFDVLLADSSRFNARVDGEDRMDVVKNKEDEDEDDHPSHIICQCGDGSDAAKQIEVDPVLVKSLATELTAKVYGRFFEFNDSEVSYFHFFFLLITLLTFHYSLMSALVNICVYR